MQFERFSLRSVLRMQQLRCDSSVQFRACSGTSFGVHIAYCENGNALHGYCPGAYCALVFGMLSVLIGRYRLKLRCFHRQEECPRVWNSLNLTAL